MLKINPENIKSSLCLAFCGKDIILRSDGSTLSADDLRHLKAAAECDCFFEEKENDFCCLGVKTTTALPEDFIMRPLRLFNHEQTEEMAMRVSRAKALMEWLRATRYCPKCGKELLPHPTLTAMQCGECGNLIFPRIEPCIIVLVRRGEEMLLARHVQRNQEIYACIAGFMEAGESAEQAVVREIKEETGITVRNVRYFGTQSWPYPAQLMIAFTAEYESGELRLQEDELSDAQWFTPDNCPASPQPGSIAYRLIHNIR